MIFYQLALKRLIEYLGLDKPSEEELRLQILLHKKPKQDYKTKFVTDSTLVFYISVLLSIIGIMIALSIPFFIVESPCEILKEKELYFLYEVAKVIDNNLDVLDYFIVVFLIMLVYVTTKMILDGVKRSKINVSPWVERGKYKLPTVEERKMFHRMLVAKNQRDD